jgi:Ni,Fe-hydrogenase III small subunit
MQTQCVESADEMNLPPEPLCGHAQRSLARRSVPLRADRCRSGKSLRYKVKDPSFHNWNGLAMSLRDTGISDFPLNNKSYNLSYCGFDLIITLRPSCEKINRHAQNAEKSIEQGYRTSRYPKTSRFNCRSATAGGPIVQDAPPNWLPSCAAACPQDAIDAESKRIDMGRCVFCGHLRAFSEGRFVKFTQDFEISTAEKEHLITDGSLPALADHAKQHFKKLFGRSLQLRQVSAAGCNSCEADLNVLATPFFDLARFGINFVASPRHADAIVVTGPDLPQYEDRCCRPTRPCRHPQGGHRRGQLHHQGGPFRGSPEITEGLDQLLPVDLFIPGCPPHPLTNLHAFFKLF